MNISTSGWIKIAGVTGIAIIALWLKPSDEKRIQKSFDSFLGEIRKSGQESLASQGMKKVRLGECIASNALFRLSHPFPENMSRSEFLQYIQLVRHQASLLDIKTHGVKLHAAEHGSYEMETTVEAIAHLNGGRERYVGSFRLEWEKQAKKWVISSARQIDVIEHPGSSREQQSDG